MARDARDATDVRVDFFAAALDFFATVDFFAAPAFRVADALFFATLPRAADLPADAFRALPRAALARALDFALLLARALLPPVVFFALLAPDFDPPDFFAMSAPLGWWLVPRACYAMVTGVDATTVLLPGTVSATGPAEVTVALTV